MGLSLLDFFFCFVFFFVFNFFKLFIYLQKIIIITNTCLLTIQNNFLLSQRAENNIYRYIISQGRH